MSVRKAEQSRADVARGWQSQTFSFRAKPSASRVEVGGVGWMPPSPTHRSRGPAIDGWFVSLID